MEFNVRSSSNATNMIQDGREQQKRNKRAIFKEDESPKFPDKKRRNIYKTRMVSNDTYSTMSAEEPKTLALNPMNSMSYVESIQRFVKHAGPVAKYIADKRCNEYRRIMLAQSLYRPAPFGVTSTIGPQPAYTENSDSFSVFKNNESSTASEQFEFKSCELHTDELLAQIFHIGKTGSSAMQEGENELNSDPFLEVNLNLTPEELRSI